MSDYRPGYPTCGALPGACECPPPKADGPRGVTPELVARVSP